MKFFAFLKDWSLPIAMLGGIAAYFIYVNIPFFDDTHAAANEIISYMQPALIFSMLFVTFCKISFRDLRFERWHFILLAFQLVSFILFSLVAAFAPLTPSMRVLVESRAKRGGAHSYTARTLTNKLVHFTSDECLIGEFAEVVIEKAGAFELFGKLKK